MLALPTLVNVTGKLLLLFSVTDPKSSSAVLSCNTPVLFPVPLSCTAVAESDAFELTVMVALRGPL
jgi:hypothetical protein